MMTTIELDERDAAVVFTEDGPDLHVPTFDGEHGDEIVADHVIIACAVAAACLTRADLMEPIIHWFMEEMSITNE